MLSAVFLIIVTVSTVVQNIFKKQYNEKTNNKGAITFCFLSALIAIVPFFITALADENPITFDAALIPHSIGFATAYTVATVFSILALQCGSLAITSLVLSYSLLIPTFYGIIFLNEKPTIAFWAGIILLAVSIFLINYKSEAESKEQSSSKFSLKWLILVALAFIGNGMCSTTQTIQVNAFKGYEHPMNNEFMILALIISTVVMFVISLFYERKEIVPSTKSGWHLAVLCGIFNGIVNVLVIVIQKLAELPVSVIFPCISGGGMILTFIVSLTMFKEKMTKAQTAGFFVGVVSVVLLNL